MLLRRWKEMKKAEPKGAPCVMTGRVAATKLALSTNMLYLRRLRQRAGEEGGLAT
jgi:hypothetical protein